ncbi:ABC transporter, partial [bacterium]|nr:ABC transporter [bacterium]
FRRDNPQDRKQSAKQTGQLRNQIANRTRPLRAEVQQIDGRLEKLSAERSVLEAQMAGGQLSGADIAEAGRRLNHLSAEVAMLEERWLAIQDEIEAITGEA